MSSLYNENDIMGTDTIFEKLKKRMLGKSYKDCYGFPTIELHEDVAFNNEMAKEEKELLCFLKRLISGNKLSEDYSLSIYGHFFWAPCYDIKEMGDSNKYTINDFSVWNLGAYNLDTSRITLYKDRIKNFVYRLNDNKEFGAYDENRMSALVLVFHYGLFLLHKFPIDGKCEDSVFPKDSNCVRIRTSFLSMFATLVLTWTVLESDDKFYISHYKALWKYHPEDIRDIKPLAGRKFLKPIFESIKYFREQPLEKYQSEDEKIFNFNRN